MSVGVNAKTFQVKFAPLAPEITFHVGEREVRIEGGWQGANRTVSYDNVEEVHYTLARIFGIPFSRFDLMADGKVVLRIENNRAEALTLSASGPTENDALFAALISALRNARPDLEVTLGEGRFYTFIWFGIGLLFLVIGIGLPTAAIISNVGSERLMVVIPVMALMALFGIGIVWKNNPWSKRPKVLIGAFLEAALKSKS